MKQRLNLRLVFFLVHVLIGTNAILASDYYWVKGSNPTSSGNWSDLTHWSNTTGGGGSYYSAVPTSADNVFFDGNSFAASSETVTVDQTQVSCKNMDWTGVANAPAFVCSSGKSVNVYGSFTLDLSISFNFSGTLNFESTSAGNTVKTAGKSFSGQLNFNGIGGGWTLIDGITSSSDIYLNRGTLNTSDQTINARSFNSNNSNMRALNMGASVFNLSYALWFWEVSNSTNMTLNAGTSTINGVVGQAGFAQSFRGGGLNYYNLNFNAVINTGGSLDGNNTFNEVSFLNHGFITGNNSYVNLSFKPGFTYTLTAGKTQTVSGSFSMNGTCSGFITVKSSSGSTSAINHASAASTYGFLYLSAISSLPAGFIANNSIDLGGNSGWTINTPAPRNLYWIGNSGNWSDGNHWSLTSGGSAAGCPPTLLDNVYFDANSFSLAGQTVIVDQPQAYCNNMNWTGMNQTSTFTSANSLNIYGSLTLVQNMTLNVTGPVNFEAQSLGKTITSATKSFGSNVNFNGVGGGWTILDDLSTSSDIFLNRGTLNSNDKTVSARSFNSNNSNVRALNMGASVFNLSYALWFWELSTSTNMTLNAGTSTINGILGQAGFSQSFRGGNLNYYNLNFNATINTGAALDGNNTFNNVSFANHGAISGSNTYVNLTFSPTFTYTLTAGKTQTITGVFSANGNCNAPIIIKSSANSASTISHTGGSVTISSVTLTWIAATGGSVFTATNSVDGGNNTGWIIIPATSQDLYWIGNGGNWSDGNHWSTTSGGAPYGCIPGVGDNVFFDQNSFASTGQTVVIDIPTANCKSMTWTNAGNSPSFSCVTANSLKIYGSLALNPALTLNFQGPVTFESAASGNTIFTGSKLFNGSISFNGAGGEWTLQDSLSTTSDIILNFGSLVTNDQKVNARSFNSNNSNVRSLKMGNSTFNLSYALWFWETTTSTNMSLDAGTSTINGIVGQAGFTQSFRGGGLNYYNLNFKAGINLGGSLDGNNSFNAVKFLNHGALTGNNSYDTLTFSPGYTYSLSSGKTQTIADELNISGTGGFPIRIQATSAGTPATFSKADGTVCADHIRISDNTATGGATFVAGANSQDLGGNTGWDFNGGAASSVTISSSQIGSTCSGTPITFTATPVNGGTPTFDWKVNGITAQTGSSEIFLTSTLQNNDTVYCVMSGTANCFSSRTIYSDTLVVVFSGGDAGVVSTSNSNVCIGGTVNFQVTGNSNSIQWQSSSGQGNFLDIENATETTFSEVINQTTLYRVYTAVGGCSDTSNTIEINPEDPPVASFSYNQGTGYTVDFTSSSSNAVSYFWDFGNNSTSTEQNPSFTFPFEGTYPVMLVVTNGCDSDTFLVDVMVLKRVGIDPIQEQSLVVSPNPFHENLNIKLDLKTSESMIVSIFNTLGQIVYSQTLVPTPEMNYQLNTSGLAKGMYYIKLQMSKVDFTRSIIKLN